MGVEVEGVGDGVEVHELHGEKILGQDTRLEAFKIDWLPNDFLKPGGRAAGAHPPLCRE